MAKTLLEFEGELLDVMGIFRISKKMVWNEEREDFDHCIVFNPNITNEKILIRDLYFKYEYAELRDKKVEELKMKVGELEHIMIL